MNDNTIWIAYYCRFDGQSGMRSGPIPIYHAGQHQMEIGPFIFHLEILRRIVCLHGHSPSKNWNYLVICRRLRRRISYLVEYEIVFIWSKTKSSTAMPTIPDVVHQKTELDFVDKSSHSTGNPSVSSIRIVSSMDKTPSGEREDELCISEELNVTDDDDKGSIAPTTNFVDWFSPHNNTSLDWQTRRSTLPPDLVTSKPSTMPWWTRASIRLVTLAPGRRLWAPIRAALPAAGQCTRVSIASRATGHPDHPSPSPLPAVPNPVLPLPIHRRPKVVDK